MMRLTNAHPDKDLKGQPIWLSTQHIVSVRPVGTGSGILTVTGVDYTVKENAIELAGMGTIDTGGF